MVELIGSFPFFLNLLAYPSALLEGAKQLLWPLSVGRHFPSAFLSPQLGHQLSRKRDRLLPQGAQKLMSAQSWVPFNLMKTQKTAIGWFQEKHLTDVSGLISQDPGPAASRASFWKSFGHICQQFPAFFGLGKECKVLLMRDKKMDPTVTEVWWLFHS